MQWPFQLLLGNIAVARKRSVWRQLLLCYGRASHGYEWHRTCLLCDLSWIHEGVVNNPEGVVGMFYLLHIYHCIPCIPLYTIIYTIIYISCKLVLFPDYSPSTPPSLKGAWLLMFIFLGWPFVLQEFMQRQSDCRMAGYYEKLTAACSYQCAWQLHLHALAIIGLFQDWETLLYQG